MTPRRPPAPADKPSAGRGGSRPRPPAARPGGSRPAPARRRSARGAVGSRRAKLGRPAMAVAAVAVVLAVLITPYLRAWWGQREDVAGLRAQVAQAQRDVEALRAERQRWNDPDYVRAQARERLNFVEPGETPYIVIGGEPAALADPGRQAATVPVAGRPWFGDVWESVRLAGGDAGR